MRNLVSVERMILFRLERRNLLVWILVVLAVASGPQASEAFTVKHLSATGWRSTDAANKGAILSPLLETKAPVQSSRDAESVAPFLPFEAEEGNSVRDGALLNKSELGGEPSDSHDETDGTKSAFELNLWTARALLLLVAAIWGTNFASVKYLEGLCFHPPCNHPPSEFAFARFGIAALVSWPLLLGQPWRVILAGLECGLTITIGYITQAMALTTIASGKCAFICSLTVVCVPVLAAVMYGKPIKPSTILAALVALTGVGVLEGMIDIKELLGMSPAMAMEANEIASNAMTATTTTTTEIVASAVTEDSLVTAFLEGPMDWLSKTIGVSKGDLIALGQPLGFGYTFLRIEHYQEQFKDVPNRVLTIAAAQCVSVGVLAFLWMLTDYHFVIPDFGYLMEPHRVVTLLWTGIVTTVLAIFLEGIALQKATATDASIAFSSEPVWASLFGFLLLNEQLGLDVYVGGAIIMLACIIGAAADFKEQEDLKKMQGLEL